MLVIGATVVAMRSVPWSALDADPPPHPAAASATAARAAQHPRAVTVTGRSVPATWMLLRSGCK
jgi:hypothetical protein